VTIPLTRLIDGIIATMRADVIPNVTDPYARGQAVGVIDLLNNIAPRVEWAHAPRQRRIEAKRALLDRVCALVPDLTPVWAEILRATPAEEPGEVLRRLDQAISEAIALVWPRRHETDGAEAAALIKAHLHDELKAEMTITRKPLFAEIAGGADGAKSA
jgi:hypothetical protein